MRAGSWARRPRLKSKKALSAVSRCSLLIGAPDFVRKAAFRFKLGLQKILPQIPASFASHLNSNMTFGFLKRALCAGQLGASSEL